MDSVEEMLERVRVDAYGDGEQLTSFAALFGDEGRFPFPATVVGAPVDVIAVEFDGDERRVWSRCAGEPGPCTAYRSLTLNPPAR